MRTGAGGVNDGTYSTEGRLQFTNSTCLKRRMAGGALPSLNAVRGKGGGSRSADSEGGKSCSDKAAFVYGTLGIAHLLRRPAEEDRTYGRLGICHMYLGDYAKTAAYCEKMPCHIHIENTFYCERCHVMYISTELGVSQLQARAALTLGGALSLQVRAGRQYPPAAASLAPELHGHWSALSCLDLKCVRQQSGSRLPWMVVSHLQTCMAHLTV